MMITSDRATAPTLAITGASILKLEDGSVSPDMTVLVRDGVIAGIDRAALPLPPDATRIDAGGKFLLPGLCDMHVHIAAGRLTDGAPDLDDTEIMARFRAYARTFLVHGITTVRNMAGTPQHLRLRAEVAEGRTLGPRIFTTGPILETRFTWAGLAAIGALVTSPAQARDMVRANHRGGYDFIKIYNDIDADIYAALVAESRALGIRIVGHVPFAAGLTGALAARQDSIEHLRSYDFAADIRPDAPAARFEGWLHTSPARLDELAARTAAAGIWNVPTLVVEDGFPTGGEAPLPRDYSRLPPWLAAMLEGDDMGSVFTERQRRAIRLGAPMRRAMVAALDRAGAKLMPGSDCPACGLVPGESLLRELELFVAAGISPLRALQCATIDAAEFLGVGHEQGRVAIGKRADLLLLDGNPLVDFSAIRRPAGVLAAGHYLPPAELRPTRAVSGAGVVEMAV